MFSRLFTLSILALSVVVSSSTLPVVDETAATIVKRQQCQPVCCNLVVKAYDDSLSGVNCYAGGIDCAFSGQLTACCTLIPGTNDARGCTVKS
ncbi:hypothetical protein V490_05879 [Pseudogymnoascus sp. VKM F-3557]|nr:hypothetical protein V490_05879 [Pseudogymnoascus sp. VKM F-3557]